VRQFQCLMLAALVLVWPSIALAQTSAGREVEDDSAVYLEQLRLLAEQGDPEAQYRLGELYEDGEIVERDLIKAVESYQEAAVQGHAGAQYALGHMYRLGIGVKQDKAAAIAWYRKAALQGDEWSQLALGDQYRIGLAVPRDLEQSTKWYRRAAEQGNIFAQYELGNAHRYGNGVAPDLAQAKMWYRRSAEAGNPTALLALNELEAGGEQDLIDQLLARADDQIARLALTTPTGDNAYETYQEILSARPDNAAALQGVRRIVEKYVELAEQAAARGASERAHTYLGKALALAPENPEVQSAEVDLSAPEPAADEPLRSSVMASVAVPATPPDPTNEDTADAAEIAVAALPYVQAAPEELITGVQKPASLLEPTSVEVETATRTSARSEDLIVQVDNLVFNPAEYKDRQLAVAGPVVHLLWNYRLLAESGQNSIVIDIDGLSQADRQKLDAAIDKAGILGQVQARIVGTVERQALATFQLVATQLALREPGAGEGKNLGLETDRYFDEPTSLVVPIYPGEPLTLPNFKSNLT